MSVYDFSIGSGIFLLFLCSDTHVGSFAVHLLLTTTAPGKSSERASEVARREVAEVAQAKQGQRTAGDTPDRPCRYLPPSVTFHLKKRNTI